MMTFRRCGITGMNNYQNITNGIEQMFQEVLGAMQEFRKKSYDSTFEFLKEKYKETFEAIKVAYYGAENDQEEVLEAIASVFPQLALQEVDKIGSKRKREFKVMDYNMAMVSYVIPLLDSIRDDCMPRLIDVIIEKWNITFPTNKIGKSSYDSIKGGFKNGICYITTAVCKSLQKPDDCYELNLLRKYRDEYLLANTSHGVSVVKEYYDIAPTIVKHIDKKQNADQIYREVWNTYLSPCVTLIETNKNEECKDIYCRMVRDLQAKYFYS